MSQSKRVVEAQAPQKTGENNIAAKAGEEDIAAKTSDELIAELQADSKKKSTSHKKKKLEEYKATQATRDLLFNRLGKTINVPLIMDDDTVMVFKIKRLSEAENSEENNNNESEEDNE